MKFDQILPFSFFMHFLSLDFTVLFVLSTCPSFCAQWCFSCILKCFRTLLTTLFTEWLSLSLQITGGIPYCWMMCLHSVFATLIASGCLVSTNTTHLENASTRIKQYGYGPALFNSMKSMCTVWKGYCAFGNYRLFDLMFPCGLCLLEMLHKKTKHM